MSQQEVPTSNRIIMIIEISFTDLVCQMRITCGRKVMDVMVPAASPKNCTNVMVLI